MPLRSWRPQLAFRRPGPFLQFLDGARWSAPMRGLKQVEKFLCLSEAICVRIMFFNHVNFLPRFGCEKLFQFFHDRSLPKFISMELSSSEEQYRA